MLLIPHPKGWGYCRGVCNTPLQLLNIITATQTQQEVNLLVGKNFFFSLLVGKIFYLRHELILQLWHSQPKLLVIQPWLCIRSQTFLIKKLFIV